MDEDEILDGEVTEEEESPEELQSRAEKYAYIMKRKADGLNVRDIAAELGISYPSAYRIIRLQEGTPTKWDTYKQPPQPKPKKRGRPRGSKSRSTIEKEVGENIMRSRPMTEALKTTGSGKAAAAVAHVMSCIDIGKGVNHDDIDSLYDCLQRYLELCYEQDFPVTAANCYLALHMRRETLNAYRTKERRANDPRYKEFADTVKLILEGSIESAMSSGSINPVIGIWWEKAHFGMVEAQKIDQPQKDPLGERKNAEELREKYAGLLPD